MMYTIFGLLSVMGTGLLAGALLTEACILVPYWKSMRPEEFLRLHHTMSSSLFRYFAPLTIAGTMLPMLYATANGNLASLIAAACGVGLLAFYFGFFRQANLSFVSEDNPQRAAKTLAKWAQLHQLRTGVAVVGFVAAIVALLS